MCVRKINSWDNFWKHQHWNCLALKTQTKSSKTTYSNCDRASKSAAVRSPSASLDAAMISLAIALTRAPFCLGLLFVPFSSRLGEEGRIMHGNNGAPLCQLAPIRRTYRLCQNRRRPNCSSMPLTWEGGEFHARGRNTAPLATQLLRRANKAGGGLGVFMVRRLMATWILLWRKCVCGVKGGGGDPFQEGKENKEGATLLLKAIIMTCSSGVRAPQQLESSKPRARSNMLHVTKSCGWGGAGLMYGEIVHWGNCIIRNTRQKDRNVNCRVMIIDIECALCSFGDWILNQRRKIFSEWLFKPQQTK